MKIVSVNIGMPRELNVDGDRQADLTVRGGTDRRQSQKPHT